MNDLKKTLKAGELAIGTFVSEVRNPNVAYLLKQCGYDYFILDNEHGTFSVETVSSMIAAARGADITVVVRIPEIRREAILKPLDSGATGLLVPQVNTVDQARKVVAYAKYPPMGERGAVLRRAHNLYGQMDAAEYLKQANEDTFIAVQAESPIAIENLTEIVSVPGIDCIFVGPFDLSVGLGIAGQVTHPREVEAIDRVMEICNKRNMPTGILLFDTDLLKPWIEKGMRFVAYSSDITMLADAAAEGIAKLRSVVK
ncbi:HpcH/HpaI aldolase/citrate lyase family protein [Candidatus Neomarinimicrobiota bacterium]